MVHSVQVDGRSGQFYCKLVMNASTTLSPITPQQNTFESDKSDTNELSSIGKLEQDMKSEAHSNVFPVVQKGE